MNNKMKIKVLVELELEPVEGDINKFSPVQLEAAAREAVEHAVLYSQNLGFVHRLSEHIATMVNGVDIVPEN